MKNLFRILMLFIAAAMLMVNFQVFAENNSDSLKATVSDAVITAKIKSQFVADDTTKAASINVETNNGKVGLTGTVDSEKEAAAAIQIAASTTGVKEVDTANLHIKSETGQNEQPIQDSYITAKVKGALIREKLINNTELPVSQIIVETRDGVVYLSGSVKQDDQIKKAETVSQSIDGVKKVVSNLKISE